jgi:hypothetical protein
MRKYTYFYVLIVIYCFSRGRQMLSESEIMFIKQLLKYKNHNV